MTTGTDDKPIKALYDHCVAVFEEMMKDATPEEETPAPAESPFSSEPKPTGFMIWEGHTTSIFSRLSLAVPYYTSVMNCLKKMGCVEQLKRGGGNSKSKWRLIRPPEESFFHAVDKYQKPRQGSLAALEQQMAAVTRRLSQVETVLGIEE